MADMSVVSAAFQVCDDGERRWRDLDLAEWLGIEGQLSHIRQLIQRNSNELERHGGLVCRTLNPGPKGGRPGTEYHLNFRQSMVLCTLSRTPRAEDVRFVLIAVFDRVMNEGRLAVAPRMELRALEVAADRIVAPILREQREWQGQMLARLDRQDAGILTVATGLSTMEQRVTDIQNGLPVRRFNLTKATKRIHIEVTERYYAGMCPCCGLAPVCEAGEKLATADCEHFYDRDQRKLEHTWITCHDCNLRLRSPEFRDSQRKQFEKYQVRCEDWVKFESNRQLMFAFRN